MLINEGLGVTGWPPQPVIRRQGWLYSDQNHPNPRNFAKVSFFFNQHAVITKQVSASPTDWQQHPRYQDVTVGVQNARTAATHSRFASLCSSVLGVKSRLVLDLSTRSLPGTSVSSGPLANRTYLGGRYSRSATNGLLRMGVPPQWVLWAARPRPAVGCWTRPLACQAGPRSRCATRAAGVCSRRRAILSARVNLTRRLSQSLSGSTRRTLSRFKVRRWFLGPTTNITGPRTRVTTYYGQLQIRHYTSPASCDAMEIIHFVPSLVANCKVTVSTC